MLIVIWTLPYAAPRDAIGLFKPHEAATLLGMSRVEIETALTRDGFLETAHFRAELDE